MNRPVPQRDPLLDLFPKTFLDDLINGRVLPIVGAGLSKNAVSPKGSMPLWDDLGKSLATEMPGYPFSGSLDAISAYAHEFGRTVLVERLAELLFVNSAKPGQAHEAFCSMPFSLVCTTNFDFLIEDQYRKSSRYCRPIIDEDQLSISNRESDVTLLKLHGDLHHPQRLVVTEDDYARFLDTFPLLATYLANLLISRTPFLIGYSLDDPDFRQIWQVVNDRLGRLRRPAYALAVDASTSDIARFARRGVRLISIPGDKSNYGWHLAEVFKALGKHWSNNVVRVSQVVQEESFEQLLLPEQASSRLCFFSVPLDLLSSYRENAYPLAIKHGFVPLSAHDVVSPGDNVLAKIEALLQRSEIVVCDATSRFTRTELEMARKRVGSGNIFVGIDQEESARIDDPSLRYFYRGALKGQSKDSYWHQMDSWFKERAKSLESLYEAEPKRLLEDGEYRAAVMSAMVLLEVRMRDKLQLVDEPATMRRMLDHAIGRALVTAEEKMKISSWMQLRNSVAHSLVGVNETEAKSVVEGVAKILKRWNAPAARPAKRRASSKRSRA